MPNPNIPRKDGQIILEKATTAFGFSDLKHVYLTSYRNIHMKYVSEESETTYFGEIDRYLTKSH